MNKYKLVVFGTGKSAEKVLKAVKRDATEMVAFVDNNFNKHGQEYKGKIIYSPKELVGLEFDYIVIAIIKYAAVKKQLTELGIEENKLLPYFDIDIADRECALEIFDSIKLLRDNYDLKLQKLIVELSNKPYEIMDDVNRYIPKVKSITETIDKLIESNVSISRFGDGEMKLIAGRDIGFQKASPDLVERLKEVLWDNQDNHIVGILNVFGSLECYTEELQNYFRTYLYEYNREFQYGLLNKDKTYYDAFITRPYISYKDKSHAEKIFDNFKAIWEGKKVVVVEGDRSRLGCGNRLFDNVAECKRIICPNENAFEKYDEILESITKQSKEYLILLALGPTATILAYDLAKQGYRAIDIGHIDIEYEWYLMGATEKVVVKNKYTNEAYGGNGYTYCVDEKYESEIIQKIKG